MALPGAFAFYDWEQDPGDLAELLGAGLRFAAEQLGAERYTPSVATFNARAITVYERAGFVATERYDHLTNGGLQPFIRMTRGPL